MQICVRVLPWNDNVYFEEIPLPPDEDSNDHVDVGDKSVCLWNFYILPEEGDSDGHWIHLAVYKNTHNIVVAESSAFDDEIWFVYK